MEWVNLPWPTCCSQLTTANPPWPSCYGLTRCRITQSINVICHCFFKLISTDRNRNNVEETVVNNIYHVELSCVELAAVRCLVANWLYQVGCGKMAAAKWPWQDGLGKLPWRVVLDPNKHYRLLGRE